MKLYRREEWSTDPDLKKWMFKEPIPDKVCRCGHKNHHIELIDHSSCIRGRIDVTVCTTCNEIVSFDVIR
jgi:hypothetical protein